MLHVYTCLPDQEKQDVRIIKCSKYRQSRFFFFFLRFSITEITFSVLQLINYVTQDFSKDDRLINFEAEEQTLSVAFIDLAKQKSCCPTRFCERFASKPSALLTLFQYFDNKKIKNQLKNTDFFCILDSDQRLSKTLQTNISSRSEKKLLCWHYLRLIILVSSVGRSPDCRAGGRGFEPQTGPPKLKPENSSTQNCKAKQRNP